MIVSDAVTVSLQFQAIFTDFVIETVCRKKHRILSQMLKTKKIKK